MTSTSSRRCAISSVSASAGQGAGSLGRRDPGARPHYSPACRSKGPSRHHDADVQGLGKSRTAAGRILRQVSALHEAAPPTGMAGIRQWWAAHPHPWKDLAWYGKNPRPGLDFNPTWPPWLLGLTRSQRSNAALFKRLATASQELKATAILEKVARGRQATAR